MQFFSVFSATIVRRTACLAVTLKAYVDELHLPLGVGVVCWLVVVAEGADDTQQIGVVSPATGGEIHCLTFHVLAVLGATGFFCQQRNKMACTSLVTTDENGSKRGFYRQKVKKS